MSGHNHVSNVNFDEICRICLIKHEKMNSIFCKQNTTDFTTNGSEKLSDMLTKVTKIPVEIGDGFPHLVCSDCEDLVKKAYQFKIQFERSYSILQKCVLARMKREDSNTNDGGNKINDTTTSTTPLENEQQGKRSTSEVQIKKRSLNLKHQKRRSKRIKTKEDRDTDSDLEDKEEVQEDKPILHPCPICTKEFCALELRKHAHTHKALKKYLNIPDKAKTSPTMKFYVKPQKIQTVSIHNKKEKIHKCVNCEYENTAGQLRIHLQTHRYQEEFKCDQCERVFKKLNHLNTHRVKHLKEFPYKCEQCGKGFVIKKNYDCHILTHNTNQELPHECNQCLKRFSNPEHLNRHMVIHTENVSYSVKYRVCRCHHCLKTFRDKASLKAHICVPIEQAVNTKFPCKTCNKVFKNSSGLYNHNRNIHKLKGAKVLCSVCGNHVSNIYNHMMRHTGEKPFECNQCGKRFIGKPQLKQHLLVHSGLKPFVCSVCAKAFNNLYNLQVHERIHKGNRCHICNICNKGFLEKSYLKKHMNVHSKLN